MATGGDMWGEDIPYFNGGLFYANDAEQDVIELDGNDARAVIRAAGDNWADVDPTIFGSLFQRALDIEGRRAELGAHYTSREDIETIVEPVLMRPLRAEWGRSNYRHEVGRKSLAAQGRESTSRDPKIDRPVSRSVGGAARARSGLRQRQLFVCEPVAVERFGARGDCVCGQPGPDGV